MHIPYNNKIMSNKSYKNWDAMSDIAISELIGDYIKHHRIEQNKTQEEIAVAAGISRSTLSLLERGRRVNLSTLIQVLRVLGLLYVLRDFIVEKTISPLLLAEIDMNKRKRARKKTKADSIEDKKSDW